MSHLKKYFKYHNLFDNKYSEQTYLAYLCRGKKKYIIRTGEYIPRFIVDTIDFIIRCNNAIARRGSEQNAINNIKEIYSSSARPYYLASERISIKDVYNKEKVKIYENEVIISVYNKLEKIVEWEEYFENNFDGFKDFIFDEIKEIDNNHYCWVVGENIIYDRSIRDNEQKKSYCVLNNDNLDKRFKDYYFMNVYVERKNKSKLYKQICYLLITLSDINNLLLKKDYKQLIELLEDYFDDNHNMDSCIDIYYLKIYYDLHHIYELISQGKNHEAFLIVHEIIEKENLKYKDLFTIFESVAIDLDGSEYSKIIEV